MNSLIFIQKIIILATPILFAITVHEVAHGWVANKLGDPTAKLLGRLTLNPIKHIDPIGTILIPGLLLFFGGFIFGWAKPVPVNWQNLKKPKRDMLFVAAAGPLTNLLMAILWALLLRWNMNFENQALELMSSAGVSINITLLVLNLLPVPPLDGSKVLMGLLPNPTAYQLSKVEPYGFLILILLLATGLLSWILTLPIYSLKNLIYTMVGLQ